MRVYVIYFLLLLKSLSYAALTVGVGKADITPPMGTPSAGFGERLGLGIYEVHDPLLAIALLIDTGEKQLVFCSVDHLGFTYEMYQEVMRLVHLEPTLKKCEIFIGSSHTHSGGGAFLKAPILGPILAGLYNPEITKFYVERTADAIIEASRAPISAKVGIGYKKVRNVSRFRSSWPENPNPPFSLVVMKFTTTDDSPIAVFFSYPCHPTILHDSFFSADFVGYARGHIQRLLGSNVEAIYFNGAEADIGPMHAGKDPFDRCDILAGRLAKGVETLWKEIEATETLGIHTEKKTYTFYPAPTIPLPLLDIYPTEVNFILFNSNHAFITIPGELSSIYDAHFKEFGESLGYIDVSILGLVNDAHGYIIPPKCFKHKTGESFLSLAGKNYGEILKRHFETTLKANAPTSCGESDAQTCQKE